MFILLSLMTLAAHARVGSPCDDDFARSGTVVYRLTKAGRASHLLSLGRNALRLTVAARTAVAAARVIVFETVPGESPTAPRRPTIALSRQLSGTAWVKLTARLTAKGVPVGAIDSLSPAVALHLLEDDDPRRPNGTDVIREVRRLAIDQATPTRGLETEAEQERLMDAAFDLKQLEELLVSDGAPRVLSLSQLRTDEPRLYRILVTERHRAWGARASQIHGHEGAAVFVLNAIHLGGADGLLEVLHAEGFVTRRLK